MRLSVRSLRRVVKGDLPIEFVQQDLTSYGGLELVRRYLHRLDVMARLRRAVADVPSDYGGGPPRVLGGGLFFVRGRRPPKPPCFPAAPPLAPLFRGARLSPPPTPSTTVTP